MPAPPYQQAPPAHFHTQHNTHNITYNNSSPFTNHQSPFHSKTDLRAHAREMHITLRKITGSRIPFYFNIESHNGVPTISYYIRNVNDNSTQKALESTLSSTHTDTSSDTSISSDTSASPTCPYVTSNNDTHKTVTSRHSTIITIDESLSNTHIKISSYGEPTTSRHSPETNLIAQISEQKNRLKTLHRNLSAHVKII